MRRVPLCPTGASAPWLSRGARRTDCRNCGATGADDATAAAGEQLLAFTATTAECSDWYNGCTYLDTLSAAAVQAFIESTHARYAQSLGPVMGAGVPGIFTDEPNYGDSTLQADGGQVPWTDALPDVFRARYGYDLLDHLPELFFRCDGYAFSKARRDYRDCITHLFVTNFARQIFDWCAQHNILFTGHVLCEETLRSQTNLVGSAMRFYEFMQAPGIDILCAQGLTRAGGTPPEILTAKQCSSSVHQADRHWMLSELYGCTGWQFTMAEHKAVGDWQAALGVNLRCQHLSWYTMEGEAKRDYPAAIFFQSPWWRDYAHVEDYFARVNVLLTQGAPVRDIAVLHPIESAWGVFTADKHDAVDALDQSLQEVQSALVAQHFDFDYLDEDALARHGAVEDATLRLGAARYRVVVVPHMLTIRASSVALLEQFMAAGGAVIALDPLPVFVDAEHSAGAHTALRAATVVDNVPALLAALADGRDRGGYRCLSLRDLHGAEYTATMSMLRHDPSTGRWIVFICHTRQDCDSGPLTLTLPAHGQAQEWDAQTGQVFLAHQEETAAGVRITTSLPPYGSRVFVIEPTPDPALRLRPVYLPVRSTPVRRAAWNIVRDEPNALVLDMPRYQIGDGAWQSPREILKVDQAARDALGVPHRGGAMQQPWKRLAEHDTRTVAVALCYRFEVAQPPLTPCQLVLEHPERFAITLNGAAVSADDQSGWWIDPSFRTLPLAPRLFQTGRNELRLATAYQPAHGLEAVYLTGDFGCVWKRTTPVMTDAPRTLALGDWVPQGLACYSGALAYQTTFTTTRAKGTRVFLEVPDWAGTLLRVRVNERDCGRILWPPYELDITAAVRDGENMLAIEVVSSRCNLLGPLHHLPQYPQWTGPSQFITDEKGANWSDRYQALPYGLLAAPVLSVRRLAVAPRRSAK
ncbi:MAG: glycosyl hydrolase [bacterium]|nr:glycosyl hydrolase [bacterium]